MGGWTRNLNRCVSLGLLLALLVFTSRSRAAGVVNPCTEASLNAALVGGGAVTFACSGTIILTGTKTISSNTSIDATGQSVTINGNNAVRLFIVNGGITASFTNLTFTAGSSTSGSAISNVGTTTITNSTFSGNSSIGLGGAIYITGVSITITNSTFSGNSSATGGAIYINAGTVAITNATFSGNSASNSGGAINRGGGTTTVRNSILSSANGGECGGNSGTITDGGYNLSKDASCGFTEIGSVQNVTAEQLALGANGGPTQTMLPGNSSIAVDAIPVGDICGILPVTTDQRGVARPQHGRCDIGSVEIPYRVPPRLVSE